MKYRVIDEIIFFLKDAAMMGWRVIVWSFIEYEHLQVKLILTKMIFSLVLYMR
jgi:hypothetical protein